MQTGLKTLSMRDADMNVFVRYRGVSGWFSHHYKRPWKSAAERISPMLASVVGKFLYTYKAFSGSTEVD